MAIASILRSAAAFGRASSRSLASAAAAVSPQLLGHFHEPQQTLPFWSNPPSRYRLPGYRGPRSRLPARFEPIDASAPQLTLDFLPADPHWARYLVDSHQGLLLLQRARLHANPDILVCDPLHRRYAILAPLPDDALDKGSLFTGAAILARAGNTFSFDAICVAILATGSPRAWVASYRDSRVGGDTSTWDALAPGEEEMVHPDDARGMDQACVRAAGRMYWHLGGRQRNSAVALDPATMKFSLVRLPTAFSGLRVFRVGEMPEDGRLCAATLSVLDYKLRLFVRRTDSDDHGMWVMEKEFSLEDQLVSLPGAPRKFGFFLTDLDAGRTGRAFLRTTEIGRYSYNMNTGKVERLITDDGLEYGRPIFAYFSA